MFSVVFLLVVTVGCGVGLTDEEYAEFPKLFHLDEYEACLAKRGGVYCLGDFQLAPRDPRHRTFQLMLEYSKNPLHFNRTVIHRGYCVSARCPEPSASEERNHTYHFERCVGRWARSHGYSTSTKAVQYCRTEEQWKTSTVELDAPKLAFAAVVFVILFLNVIGTAYDLITPDDSKKNAVLMSWSMRKNWGRLTAFYEDADPRQTALAPAQGVRAMLMVVEIALHVGLLRYRVYTHNSRDLDNMLEIPAMMMGRNDLGAVQSFVVLASFLLGYQLLLHSKTNPLSLKMLPQAILSRFLRLTPVHLMVVGFAASWWPALGGGPMWTTVEAESATCRSKFWLHAFFLHNLVRADEQCLIPAWFTAVDMQLFIVACVVALTLARWPARAQPALWALAVGSTLLNAGLIYAYQWKASLFFINPEILHSYFVDMPSFRQYYTAPWGSLPSCFMGLLLAQIHFQLQERGFKAADHKWLVWMSEAAMPLMIAFVMTGLWAQHWCSRLAVAAYTAVERPLFGALTALGLLGVFNVKSYTQSLFAWRFWNVLGRLSLSALMLHWVLILSLLAANSLPIHYSFINLLWEYVATTVLTFLLAVPLTVLVEFPIPRFVTALLRK